MTGVDALGDDALDFWTGEWSLSWGTGGHGTNSIRRILDDRAIEESFAGTEPDGTTLLGRSLSIRDAADGRWRQVWVDSSGAYLDFEGIEVDGRVAFQRATTIDGINVLQRMVWVDVTPASLRWQWLGSRDGGETWRVNWEIAYRRS